jgi:hypothetical protein
MEEKMKADKHIELEWKISNLISEHCNLILELNDLLWKHYEKRFIERQKEDVIYRGKLTEHMGDDVF